MTETEPDDEKGFVDERAKQDSLVKKPARPEKESQIDRGASDQFADDRIDVDESDDNSTQSDLTGDHNQKTLNGDNNGPEWF